MAGTKKSQLPEVGMINDGDYFDIVTTTGQNRKVAFSVIKNASSAGTNDHVDLVAPDGTVYRAKVNNEGELNIIPAEAWTAEAPDPSQSARFAGLMINQIYGGGSNINGTPVSHHFIELYNNNASMMDFNLKGMYLSYKAQTGEWQSLALEGVIPYQHSFLVRCRQVSNPRLLATRMVIDYYDQEWDIDLGSNGFSIYLSIGEPSNDYENPFNHDGAGNTAPGYIDLLAAGGTSTDYPVRAYEGRYRQCMDKNTALRRLDFADSANNMKDARPLDYRTCNVDIYRPRRVKDGPWDVYFDKAKIKETVPNLVNICYGKDGETTRTFTWQSVMTNEGWLRYRIEGTSKWTAVESDRTIVSHYDCDVTVHRVLVRDLQPGNYEYQVGEEGMWSDIETFVVKTYGESDTMRILWTSDQQGWTEEEYQAWNVCCRNIHEWEGGNWDFALNTGDISQNANRSFEWRYYFRFSQTSTRNCCHMITCGNNDLIDKKYSDAFMYYMTPEDYFLPAQVETSSGSGVYQTNPNKSTYNSCHSYDLGYVHFVCLNSNQDYSMFDNATEKVDDWIKRECAWLDADLARDKMNPKTRWVICYMHYGPFTCVRPGWIQRFIPVFEKHRVHLVLCGHNHTYSRSIPIYSGYDGDISTKSYDNTGQMTAEQETALGHGTINHTADYTNGTYYLMNNAAGYKNTGKEGIQQPSPWWYGYTGTHPSQPTYITLEISWNTIKAKAYQILKVLGKDENGITIVNDYGVQTQYLFDECTINWRSKGQL